MIIVYDSEHFVIQKYTVSGISFLKLVAVFRAVPVRTLVTSVVESEPQDLNFCLSGTGTEMHYGSRSVSGTGFGSGSNIIKSQ
jgi:hypothetical protein